MTQQSLAQLRDKALRVVDVTANKSTALMLHAGVNPDDFKLVLREALIANGDIVKADPKTLASAVRECCQYGLVPNGDQAAIVVYGGEAKLMPMEMGIRRMAKKDLDVQDIRLSLIYKGDEFSGNEQDGTVKHLQTTESLLNHSPDNVIGGWVQVIFRHRPPLLRIFNRSHFDRAKSSASSKSKAWNVWPDRMQEKYMVKTTLWKLRDELGIRETRPIFDLIQEDNRQEAGEGEVIDVPEALPETPSPKPKPKPKAKPKPKPKGAEEAPDEPPAPPEPPTPPPEAKKPEPKKAAEEPAGKNWDTDELEFDGEGGFLPDDDIGASL